MHAVVNIVMNLVFDKGGEFDSLRTIDFSSKIVLHGVTARGIKSS
jgi:hypothetical protein